MKNILAFILVVFYTHSAVCQTETPNGVLTPYDIKSGKITYRFVNGIQQGIKVVVFDNYGQEEKMTGYSIMTSSATDDGGNYGDTIREILLKKDAFIYKINLNDGTGFKLNRNEKLPLNLDALRPGQVVIGPDTILDRPCLIIEIFGSLRTWYWNRIPIRKQVIGTGMTSKIEDYAISIDENYVPNKSEFEIPDGIKMK